MAILTPSSRTGLYRTYIRHLRLIQDPHVWHIALPRFKNLLEEAKIKPSRPGFEDPSGSYIPKVKKPEHGIKKPQKELNKLRAAVACHPHALKRLLEECYGQKGTTRWDLIRTICRTSNPSQTTTSKLQIPSSLLPLTPPPTSITDTTPRRARTWVPDTAIRKAAQREWTRNWKEVKVPLILPTNLEGTRTGWENSKVIYNLRILSGMDDGVLDTSRLSPGLQKLFPNRRYGLPDEAYPSPPPRATRSNPSTWKRPRELSPRLLMRTYRRLWESLVWVKPSDARGSSVSPVGHGGKMSSRKRKNIMPAIEIEEGTSTTEAKPTSPSAEESKTGIKWTRCSWEDMMACQGNPSGSEKVIAQSGRKAVKWSVASDDEVKWFR